MSRTMLKISIILSVLSLVLLAFLYGAVYTFKKVAIVDSQRTRYASEDFLSKSLVPVGEVLKRVENSKREVMIDSKCHGHKIPVEYLTVDDNYDKLTVVLIHGHGLGLESMYAMAEVFLDNDMNVVLYDQRAHGRNTAKWVTFGYYEKDDLADVVDYIRENKSRTCSIGILGQSMGAATVGFYSGTEHAKENVDFVILDCPYNNMESIIMVTGYRRGYGRLQLNVLKKLGSILNYAYMKFSYKDMDVVKAVGNSEIPTLVYESRYDRTCPYYMADEVFDAIGHDKKEKVMFLKSEHIKGFYKEKDKYVDTLLKFINKYRKDEVKS